MMVSDLEGQKWIFLNNEFLTLSINGALGHSSTYCTEPEPDERRQRLREKLRELLRYYAEGYVKSDETVREDIHNKNIQELADKLSKEFNDVLEDGTFRTGIAQKALNLYLKYLWCMNKMPSRPPHCPFDRRVLHEIRAVHESWTKCNTTKEYMSWVKGAEEKAGSKEKVPDWELYFWNESLRKNSQS